MLDVVAVLDFESNRFLIGSQCLDSSFCSIQYFLGHALVSGRFISAVVLKSVSLLVVEFNESSCYMFSCGRFGWKGIIEYSRTIVEQWKRL